MKSRKKLKEVNISIEITDVYVDGRYFGFTYHSDMNNGIAYEGEYESDHVHSENDMMDMLEKGYALELVLDELSDKVF